MNPVMEINDSKFLLVRPFTFVFPWNNKKVIIPAGYRTNFATIPWYVRWLISPIDPVLLRGALIHDYLVGEFGGLGIIYTADNIEEDVSWAQSAAILRQMVRLDGGTTWKRQAVYWAVRLHGVFK